MTADRAMQLNQHSDAIELRSSVLFAFFFREVSFLGRSPEQRTLLISMPL
jgi:hypothetical protein